MMGFYWLMLGILGVWRITHLLQAEDGPWDLVVRFRRKAGNGLWGKEDQEKNNGLLRKNEETI